MSRSVTGAMQTGLVATPVFPAFLVSCAFTNETIYLWSGLGTISWNGQTWYGTGSLGTISPIGESSTVQAQGITLTMSGIDPQWMDDCLAHITTSGQAQVWLALFSSPGGSMIASPIPAYIGLMDAPVIDVDTNSVKISIAVENRLSDLNRARGGRLTAQDQAQRHPSDNGLLYVSLLQDTFVNWRS